jgi:hypothetical protein
MAKDFSNISDLLKRYEQKSDKYVSQEFQQYGWELAQELGDLSHKALYIKLAKTTSRVHLEAARSFVKDASNARSKGRLFMWKLSELKKKV